MNKLSMLALVAVSFSMTGCVAVWGGSYNIDFADKDMVQVNYDSSVINYPHMLGKIASHCAAYGKGYVNDSTIRNGWGITMAVYRCKGHVEPNVRPETIVGM